MRQTLARIGDKVQSAVLIGEGFMPDGLEQKVAAAHQALHLILLLQDQSKLLLHVYIPAHFLGYFQVGNRPVCSLDKGQSTYIYQSQMQASLLMSSQVRSGPVYLCSRHDTG